MKVLKRTLLAGFTAVAMAGAASASVLGYANEAGLTIPGWDRGPVSIGGQSVNPKTDPVISSFADSSVLTHFNNLLVNEDAKLEFTFIISEAGNRNTANLFLNTGGPGDDVEIFNNKRNNNPNYITTVAAGVLDFTYCTDGRYGGGEGCISNIDGLSVGNPGLKIASSKIFTSDDGRDLAFFFFGDGAGDSDLTDLVVAVQAMPVPLPAGAFLMGSALAGLGFAARRRRKS